ncbi:MAG: peptidylprolyl isomerase [Anaerolineae bacterium]|nr:peptidylprolyl isomerase [Anaerolineae bacterium]MBN8618067.1 peptidylprolyl isomerase [Anaerolineae bacterium]
MIPLRALSIIALLLLAACGGGTEPPTAPPVNDNIRASTPIPPVQPTSAIVPTDPSGVPLVARVNGEGITTTEFERALTRRQQEVLDAASPDALRMDVLNQMIEQKLIIQGATAQNIVVSDEEVMVELQAQVEQAGGQAAWDQWLVINLYSAEEFPSVLKGVLTANRVRDMLTTDLEGNIRQVNARHILLRTESDANDILNSLNAGQSFEELAAQYSQDETTRDKGGDLGWFTMDELLVPELAQVAFSIQPGQIAGPVATELGYHVIQVVEFADRPVEPERRVYIAQTRFENWLRPLYDNAIIERFIA